MKLRNEVYNICGVVPTNIKIVRDKTTGECRGIGFLDFDSVDVAKKVITTTNRSMNIYEAKVTLDYSIKPAQADKKVFRDWLCDCVCCPHGFESTFQRALTKNSTVFCEKFWTPYEVLYV